MNQVLLVLNNMDFKFPSIRPLYNYTVPNYGIYFRSNRCIAMQVTMPLTFSPIMLVCLIDHVIVTNDNQIIARSII